MNHIYFYTQTKYKGGGGGVGGGRSPPTDAIYFTAARVNEIRAEGGPTRESLSNQRQ